VARAPTRLAADQHLAAVILQVDAGSAVPPYEQLRLQIRALVAGIVLRPGARLPAIRQLANDLGLAGGTVARAYRELEADGIVSTHGRHGTVVAESAVRDAAGAELLQSARRFVQDAVRLGAGLDDAVSAVRVAFTTGDAS
jgi:DNA-binding transcriptional regulator YhcF (GntR family)